MDNLICVAANVEPSSPASGHQGPSPGGFGDPKPGGLNTRRQGNCPNLSQYNLKLAVGWNIFVTIFWISSKPRTKMDGEKTLLPAESFLSPWRLLSKYKKLLDSGDFSLRNHFFFYKAWWVFERGKHKREMCKQ